MKKCDAILGLGCAALAFNASALSLGGSQGQVVLGSPVDLVFDLRPDEGKDVASSCVTAEVLVGDHSSADVAVLPLPPRASGVHPVRVRGRLPVNEPVVVVKLAAGCQSRSMRSYTFLADPPQALAASVQPIDVERIQPSVLPAARSSSMAAERPMPTARDRGEGAARSSSPRPRPVARPAPVPVAAPVPAPAAASAVGAPPVAAPKGAAEPQTPQSRLRMEPLEAGASAAGRPGGAQAAAAVPVAAAAAAGGMLLSAGAGGAADAAAASAADDAQTQRFLKLEEELARLKAQSGKDRAQVLELRTQLEQARDAGLPGWVYALMGLLALALASVAWLWQRIRQERAAPMAWRPSTLGPAGGETAWSESTYGASPVWAPPADEAVPTAAPAAAPVASPVAAAPGVKAAVVPAMAVPASAALATPAAEAAVPAPQAVPAKPAPLPTQAMLDVLQQAEFYASVGENDQAIALLQSHIDASGQNSPSAYLELLQLLYRLSRSEAFEQARRAFEHHFNVQVPSLLGFADKGRSLSEAYPSVLERIEALWSTDELKGALQGYLNGVDPFGADLGQRFDLAAFEELLALYNVAQTQGPAQRGDLHRHLRPAAAAAVAGAAAYAGLEAEPAGAGQVSLAGNSGWQVPPAAAPTVEAPNAQLLDSLSLEWPSAPPAATAPAAPVDGLQPLSMEDLGRLLDQGVRPPLDDLPAVTGHKVPPVLPTEFSADGLPQGFDSGNLSKDLSERTVPPNKP